MGEAAGRIASGWFLLRPARHNEAMERPKLAFIGLGTMGAPMAQRLVDAGYEMTVHNRTRERERQVTGAKRAASPREAATGQDIVFTMVSDTPDVRAVIAGED